MLKDKSLNTFINELSSSKPTPGGGSVGALSASLSAALTSMVFNLTIGKKIYEGYSDEEKKLVKDSLVCTEKESNEFISLINRDIEEFTALMQIYKLPKSTEVEKGYRNEKLQEGYNNAMQVPLAVAQKSLHLYNHILIACKLGNSNVISDAGVAAIMLQAAIESSVINVMINLSYMDNKEQVNEIKSCCNEILKKGEEQKNEIMTLVYRGI